MRKIDIIRFSGGNFLRRKARSTLTVLGVIIGTAAVVIMLSIGIGMNKGFEEQASSYGDLRQIQVYELWGVVDEDSGEWIQNESREPLDDIGLENVRAIEHVAVATPYYQYWGAQLIKDATEKAQYVTVTGIDPSSMEDLGYTVLYGRLLNESDVGTNNFVMNFNVPFNFFKMRGGEEIWFYSPNEDEKLSFNPVSDKIKYQFTWFYNYGTGAVDNSKPRIKLIDGNCVGILVRGSNDYQPQVFMAIDSVRSMAEEFEANQNKYYNSDFGGGWISDDKFEYDDDVTADGRTSIYENFTVLVDSQNHVQQVEKAIAKLGYQTNSNMEWLTSMQEQTKFLRSILGAIGAVAFFVAAISIANTMVMSIYERTREIGIMKVMGCKLADIREMFLVEAGIIGVIGGLMGIELSYIISYLINTLAKSGGMSMMGVGSSSSELSVIPLWLDVAALILATVVGVVSGLYPAIRATRLSALDAIRNE